MRIVNEISDDLYKRADVELEKIKGKVEGILSDVQENGDSAVRKYTEKFDGAELKDLEVSKDEIGAARNTIDPDLLTALQTAAQNIRKFAQAQMPRAVTIKEDGFECGYLIRPFKTIGCYVPGGRAAYPSTVLMNAIPAKVAGVGTVVVCTPPEKDGKLNPAVLVACDIAGVDRVFSIGGVQAIASMAYGTETVPKVQKIVGPGNIYVAAAKELIKTETDFLAGPSEVLVLSDETGKPNLIASELLAQAEHDPEAVCVLVTTSERLAEEVNKQVERMLESSGRREILEQALEKYSYILVVKDLEKGIWFANNYAPEHMVIMAKEDILENILDKIKNAGSIFIGEYSPVAAGDYCTGPNHVLPTSGKAAEYSGLSVEAFLKKPTWERLSKKKLEQLKPTIEALAKAEGLDAHAESVKVRFEEEK